MPIQDPITLHSSHQLKIASKRQEIDAREIFELEWDVSHTTHQINYQHIHSITIINLGPFYPQLSPRILYIEISIL